MQDYYQKAQTILEKSTILFKKNELQKRITEMAIQIEQDIKGTMPVFLTIMNGGMFFATSLLSQIKEPLICDYVHASRYGTEDFGSTHITWYHQPKIEKIKGKTVYILDDILDEGHTLAEVVRFLNQIGAAKCKVAVLVDKTPHDKKPIQADYVGVISPNHFLFGCGMDIQGLYRQLPDIYIYNSV